ncbi:hypothetical protein [Yoonia sp. BS5-3]|uniref:Uncharacterized protein n=1 Tax=Yoonia phaeophyticola TaxID=3137369 RepID=A0ABZ2V3F5_9RHOB
MQILRKLLHSAIVYIILAGPVFPDANSEANLLFTEAMLKWRDYQSVSTSETTNIQQIEEWHQALSQVKQNLESIVMEHPGSDLSVQLLIGPVGDLSIEAVNAEIARYDSELSKLNCFETLETYCLLQIAEEMIVDLPVANHKFAYADLWLTQAMTDNPENVWQLLEQTEYDEELSWYYSQMVTAISIDTMVAGNASELTAVLSNLDSRYLHSFDFDRMAQRRLFQRVGLDDAIKSLVEAGGNKLGDLIEVVDGDYTVDTFLNHILSNENFIFRMHVTRDLMRAIYRSDNTDTTVFSYIARTVQAVTEGDLRLDNFVDGYERVTRVKLGLTDYTFDGDNLDDRNPALLYLLFDQGDVDTALQHVQELHSDQLDILLSWLIDSRKFETAAQVIHVTGQTLYERQKQDLLNLIAIKMVEQRDFISAFEAYEEVDDDGELYFNLLMLASLAGEHEAALNVVINQPDIWFRFIGMLAIAEGRYLSKI